eukprot:g2748.t1
MGPLNRSIDTATVVGQAEGVVVQQQQERDTASASPPSAAAAAPAVDLVLTRSAPQHPPTAPPSAVEWKDLVATLRNLQLGRQQARARGTAPRRPRPKPVRSRSDQTFEHGTRGGKRAHDCCVSSNLASNDDGSGSDSGSDGEDSAGLGAPPLLPPTLKRAKACSFSPSSSTAEDFADSSKKSSLGSTAVAAVRPNTPRQ